MDYRQKWEVWNKEIQHQSYQSHWSDAGFCGLVCYINCNYGHSWIWGPVSVLIPIDSAYVELIELISQDTWWEAVTLAVSCMQLIGMQGQCWQSKLRLGRDAEQWWCCCCCRDMTATVFPAINPPTLCRAHSHTCVLSWKTAKFSLPRRAMSVGEPGQV